MEHSINTRSNYIKPEVTYDSRNEDTRNVNIKLELPVAEELIIKDEMDSASTSKERHSMECRNADDSCKQNARTERMSFECNTCSEIFFFKSQLHTHIKTAHKNKSFVGLVHNAQASHVRQCSEKTSFQCAVCNYKVSRKYGLKRHLKTHIEERPFQCSVCYYKCSQNSDLQKHIRIHTGEKPFHCKICDSNFSLKGNLQRHVRTHTGEKPFQCKVCDHRFSQKGHLNEHVRSHSGKKLFQCGVCGHSFTRKHYLQKHIRMHMDHKPSQ